MLESIKQVFAQSCPAKAGTVVHWGAGPYFDADLYDFLGAKRFILVEADPDAAEDLREAAAGTNCTVQQILITPTSGSHSLNQYSLSALNGVFALGDLQSVYPRARKRGDIIMSGVTPSELLADVELDPAGAHFLIIDLPGLDPALVGVVAPEILQRFAWILIRGAGATRMAEAESITKTCELLQIAGFKEEVHSGGESLFPVVAFSLDRRALELQSLSTERDDLKAKLDAAAAQHAASAKDIQARFGALATERDALTKQRDDLKAKLDAAVSENDALKKSTHERAVCIAELEAQVADQAERQRQIDEEIAKAEGQLEMLASLFESGVSRSP